jgi:hypothetical protein
MTSKSTEKLAVVVSGMARTVKNIITVPASSKQTRSFGLNRALLFCNLKNSIHPAIQEAKYGIAPKIPPLSIA